MEQQQNSGHGQRPSGTRRRRRRRRRPRAAATGTPPAAGTAAPPETETPSGPAGAPAAASPAAPAPEPAAHEVPPAAAATAAPTAPEPSAAAAADDRSVPVAACPLCAEPVHNLYTAIGYGESCRPAHFDCVLAMLSDREELTAGERVCYLGGGSFGVVQTRVAGGQRDRRGAPLSIRKRIPLEEVDPRPDWRRTLRLVPARARQVAASIGAETERARLR